jgi:hypothetical protein
MNQRPFEIMRWESPKPPTPDFLERMLVREGLTPENLELPADIHTPEMKFEQSVVRVLVAGHIQYSFPGYGVIELDPGDMLEIQPGVLHDAIVSASQAAVLLQAFKTH